MTKYHKPTRHALDKEQAKLKEKKATQRTEYTREEIDRDIGQYILNQEMQHEANLRRLNNQKGGAE